MRTYKFDQLEPETKAHIEATRDSSECQCHPKPDLTEQDSPDAWYICSFHKGFDTAAEALKG